MSMSDIVDALESGLITEREATEQGMVDSVSDLYGRLHGSGHRLGSRGGQMGAERPSSIRSR